MELQPVTATLAWRALVVAPFELASSGARLRSEAQLDLVRRVLSASSRGEIDLRALTPFVGAASLGGTARLDFSVAGPLDAPAGKGRAELEGVTIRARALPQAITDGAGTLVLDGSTIGSPASRPGWAAAASRSRARRGSRTAASRTCGSRRRGGSCRCATRATSRAGSRPTSP